MNYRLGALLLSFVFLLSSQSFSYSISSIKNLKDVEKVENMTFDKAQLKALEEDGFFLIPTLVQHAQDPNTATSQYNEMVAGYKSIGGDADEYARAPENTVFITSDFLLHLYHILIDRTFQAIEEDEFHPTLWDISEKLFDASLEDYENDPSELKKSLVAYFLVPLVLLEAGDIAEENEEAVNPYDDYESYMEFKPADDTTKKDSMAVVKILMEYKEEVPKDIYKMAEEELLPIMMADTIGESEILPGEAKKIDYTQFRPRSHYTKNELLRSYFRAMMWYGRMSFELKNEDLTRMALYIVKNVDLTDVLADWESIYDPTVFFVGESDDLTIYDYTKIMKKVYGKITDDLEFKNDAKFAEFVAEAKKLKGPAILSQMLAFESMEKVPGKEELLASTKGFRFMGQRFIPDSYIFSTLTQGDEPPDPETGEKLPSIPTALMAMSIFGSETADQLLDDWIKKEAPRSAKVIAKYKKQLVKEFAAIDEETWTHNIYWGWIYTLKSLFQKYGKEYPAFMQNQAWNKKCLLTSLGSWTELRHDTLLYAKQSAAEMGGMEAEEKPPVPKGYVEPNADFFSRLIDLNKKTVETLDEFGLLEGDKTVKFQKKYEKFAKALDFLQELADKELAKEKISDDDYERLRTIGYELTPVVWPVPYEDLVRSKDSWTGLIADVHTAYNTGQILYEAIGRPMKIFVVIDDEAGTRLTRGLTYSYFEFTKPLAKRMSDEDWQAIIYEKKGTAPPMPEWTDDIIR